MGASPASSEWVRLSDGSSSFTKARVQCFHYGRPTLAIISFDSITCPEVAVLSYLPNLVLLGLNYLYHWLNCSVQM